MLVLMGLSCGGVSLNCRRPSGCWCPSLPFEVFLIVLCMSAQGVCLVAVCNGWRIRAWGALVWTSVLDAVTAR